jgi:hypothetical protein
MLVACAGCGSGSAGAGDLAAIDRAAAKWGAKFLLAEEPAGAVGVLEARETLSAGGENPPQIVLVGRIGAVGRSPWDDGHAAFLLADPACDLAVDEHAHGAGHDHDNCPFCRKAKQEADEATAMVQVLDEQGKLLAVDARRLLGLRSGQLIVVQGLARIDPLGQLVVDAAGIYVRE